jgi:hypothetical protein
VSLRFRMRSAPGSAYHARHLRSHLAVGTLIDERLDHGRDLLLLRPWEFGGRFKQAAHPASRPDGGASPLLRLAPQFIHRNIERPPYRRRQPRRNVAHLGFKGRELALWNAERLGQLRL